MEEGAAATITASGGSVKHHAADKRLQHLFPLEGIGLK